MLAPYFPAWRTLARMRNLTHHIGLIAHPQTYMAIEAGLCVSHRGASTAQLAWARRLLSWSPEGINDAFAPGAIENRPEPGKRGLS